jgi:hypothetical protein
LITVTYLGLHFSSFSTQQDLTVNATYFFVSGGRVEIGTEKDPFLQNVVITLHGDRWKDVEIPNVGSKVLAVSDATFTNLVRCKSTLTRIG